MRQRRALVGASALLLALLLLLHGQSAGQDEPHGDLVMDCGDCHDPENWVPVDKPPIFRHEGTGFALQGAHAGLACGRCHRTLVFNRVGAACADCHEDAHRGELGFRCESCHTPTTWTNQREMFRRHSRTRFPLLSIHARLDCTACHRDQRPYQYANTPAECGACHYPTYLQTTDPHHPDAGFSTRCEDCHPVTSTTWRGARFSHPESFPLRGGHARLPCARCHSGGIYEGLSSACVSCHQADYAATTTPSHQAAAFPTTCQDCHTIDAWRPARFDHGQTRFPLTGAHLQVDCARCHEGGRYAGTPTDCYACHQADYAATTTPSHLAAGFPTDCQACHSTSAWRPANFDHGDTRFPLTGAHRQVDCARCHEGGRYAGTPTNCYACHQADYAGTTDPNHQAAGFPTGCQICHNTSAWRPASFDHNQTRFPLTGAHRQVDCARCHEGGRYTGTPTDCYVCHQDDYAATTSPSHQAAGFPTDCRVCHDTSAWRPARFNHDASYFPIYSGTHAGEWSSCGDCHVNPGNYGVFECIFCHPHSNKPQTDAKHRQVTGYLYQSAACYRCHRDGRADFVDSLRRPGRLR